jgi:hypothetical protein
VLTVFALPLVGFFRGGLVLEQGVRPAVAGGLAVPPPALLKVPEAVVRHGEQPGT